MVRTVRTGISTLPGPYNRVLTTTTESMQMVDKTDASAEAIPCNVVRTDFDMIPPSCRCIGAACAMWRWAGEHPSLAMRTWGTGNASDDSEPNPRPLSVPDDARWIPYDGDTESGQWIENEVVFATRTAAHAARRKGYCGLAGFPAAFTG